MGATKVTQADVEAEIANEHYWTAADALVAVTPVPNGAQVYVWEPLKQITFCLLVLHNGHKVVGINYGPVDPAEFDAEHGRKDARAKAIEQVWDKLGFRLRDRLHREAHAAAVVASIDGVGD